MKSDYPTQRNENIDCRKNLQRGFSLIEMMIALVIFLIVTGSVYGLLQIGRIDRNRASRRADVMKNARAAIYQIGRDALNAGLGYHKVGAVVPDNFAANLLGLPADPDVKRDFLTAIIAGNNVNSNDLQDDPNVKTDVVAFAFRDLDFNNGSVIQLANVSAPGGSPNVAEIQTKNPGDAAAVNKYDLYLIESSSSQVAVMATQKVDGSTVDFAPGDPLNLNQAFNGSGVDGSLLVKCTATLKENCTTYLASMKRFFWVSYKVKQDGTLVRTSYGNNTGGSLDEQMQEQPLAYNVKNLQFRYVLNDGTVTDNPSPGSAGPDGVYGTADDVPSQLNQITQITITIQVVSTEADEQTGKLQVITLNATFSTRNLQYDAS